MIQKANFGRTGHISSRIIFGSWAINRATPKEADQVLEILLEYGVNHIDTAPMYGNAENLIGSWMKRHRDDFFLATKSRKRASKAAWNDLQESLNRLQVDYVDLWQIHGLTNPAGWQKVMGPGGALEAFVEARDKGLVRFIGVTGHGNHVPEMHMRSLEHFNFEAVMLPYNYCQMQNLHYAKTFNSMAIYCRENNVALQTIQAIARQPSGKQPCAYNTFYYEPLDTMDAIDKSVGWALGLPDSFVVSVGDLQLLPKMLEAASRFEKRPSDVDMNALVNQYNMQPIFTGW